MPNLLLLSGLARLTCSLLATLTVIPINSYAGWLSDEQAIMGTAVRVELWHEDQATGRAAISAVMAEIHRIDRLMSTYKEDSAPPLI